MLRYYENFDSSLSKNTPNSAHPYRCGDNHPCWRGHLDMLLEVPKKVAQVEHLAALPYADTSSFMTELRNESRMALALLNSRSRLLHAPAKYAARQSMKFI